jgi:hypothetical protein
MDSGVPQPHGSNLSDSRVVSRCRFVSGSGKSLRAGLRLLGLLSALLFASSALGASATVVYAAEYNLQLRDAPAVGVHVTATHRWTAPEARRVAMPTPTPRYSMTQGSGKPRRGGAFPGWS